MLKTVFPSLAASALVMLGGVGFAGESTSSSDQASTEAPSTNAKIEAIFSGSKTLNGTDLVYPEGKPELRMFRVELPAGGKIPLHTHPAPMLVYVQATDSGELLNTRVQPDGREVSSVFKPGESFIEGARTPLRGKQGGHSHGGLGDGGVCGRSADHGVDQVILDLRH